MEVERKRTERMVGIRVIFRAVCGDDGDEHIDNNTQAD